MTVTSFGVAVVPWDTHLSKTIMDNHTLGVAEGMLSCVKQFIPAGGVVCDIGACLGSHTHTFSKYVGARGRVHAFEPNPIASECLIHNMQNRPNVTVHLCALGKEYGHANMVKDLNLGMSRTMESQCGPVVVTTLDHVAAGWSRLDFIKMDAEGAEPDILDGAKATITRHRPTMLIEINQWQLVKHGFSKADVHDRLQALNYSCRTLRPQDSLDMPEVDVVCLPV